MYAMNFRTSGKRALNVRYFGKQTLLVCFLVFEMGLFSFYPPNANQRFKTLNTVTLKSCKVRLVELGLLLRDLAMVDAVNTQYHLFLSSGNDTLSNSNLILFSCK